MADDLFTALAMFQKGVQDLSQSRILNNANEAVQQIRASEADMAQKNQMLRDLSDQVAIGLLSSGAPASTAQVATMFRPKEPSSLMEGLLSSDPSANAKAQEVMQIQAQAQADAAALAEQRIRERQEIGRVQTEEFRMGREERKVSRDIKERTVPGVGVASSKADAKRVRQELPKAMDALDGVDELLKFSQLDKLNPVQRRKATVLAESIKGSLRLSIIGPGAISDQERAILDNVIANPTNLLQIPLTERAALKQLQDKLRSNVQNSLNVTFEDFDTNGQVYKKFYGQGSSQPMNQAPGQQPVAPPSGKFSNLLRPR